MIRLGWGDCEKFELCCHIYTASIVICREFVLQIPSVVLLSALQVPCIFSWISYHRRCSWSLAVDKRTEQAIQNSSWDSSLLLALPNRWREHWRPAKMWPAVEHPHIEGMIHTSWNHAYGKCYYILTYVVASTPKDDEDQSWPRFLNSEAWRLSSPKWVRKRWKLLA
jgi:hypothetical protein